MKAFVLKDKKVVEAVEIAEPVLGSTDVPVEVKYICHIHYPVYFK
jgi:NADPH:quinone reductase-like Zn-dependent oxidoreductase